MDIAKNYLNAKELKELNRIVTMYLDYAEHQADRGRIMTMKDWIDKLDSFLTFNEHDVLTNPGKVSAEVAKTLAEKEFDKYDEKVKLKEALQPVSDFDKLVEQANKTVSPADTHRKIKIYRNNGKKKAK